jgi:phage shock protein A
MAPMERELQSIQSRDLAWISEFVMQQVAIMMHPVMDHLEQTDEAADYTQRAVEQMSTDIAELRTDLERTNKYLGILRQGMGMQNESRCVLQRSVESTTRTVARLDDSMDNLLGIVRRAEDNLGQMGLEMRGVSQKHGELTKQVTESTASIEDLHAKMESITIDHHALKDNLRSNEARLEIWQRDLRELRRSQLGIASKFEDKNGRQQPSSSQGCRGPATDTWPQKKSLASTASYESGCCSTPESGDGEQKHKRMGRVGSASRHSLLQPELKLGALPSRSSSQAVLYESIHASSLEADESIFGSHPSTAVADETTPSSRLPLLAKQPSGTRPQDGTYHSSLRLRFSETLARQPSRGSLN